MEDKIPPQDIEAEQSVLGAMMLSKDAVAVVVTKLKADYFYRESHSRIFDAIVTLFQQNQPVDIITLSNQLKKTNSLDEAGGSSYLAEILNSVPTAANAEKYADIVSEKAILRKLIDIGGHIIADGFNEASSADVALENAQKHILDLSKERIQDQFVLLRDILMPVVDSLHQIADKDNKILGISTGYKDLDQLTSGFQKSELIILAARPSMGKTSLALNFALNAALINKNPIAIFSLEMPKEQIALRMLSAEAHIDSSRLRTANMADHEYKNLTQALGRLSEASIYLDDTPGLSPLELKAKLRRLQAETDIKLVLIDYLQLMRIGRKKIENRFQEVSEIVREVKASARELGVPIIALSQLSREVEKRDDKVPKLSDLRETGEIEQTADVVMFIHRPDYYEHSKEATSMATIYIEKNRNGPTGSADLIFKRDISKFYNCEKAPISQ